MAFDAKEIARLTAIVLQLLQRAAPAFWNGTAGAVPRAAILLASFYVARTFGPDVFARYAVALTTVMVVGSLVGASLTTVGSKFIPELSGGRPDWVGPGFAALTRITVVLALLLGLAVFLLAPGLATLFRLEPTVNDLLRVGALVIVAVILHGGTAGILIGSGRFRYAALANLAGFFAFAAGVVPLSSAFGPSGTLLALGLVYTVGAGIGRIGVRWARARSAHRVAKENIWVQCKSMLSFLMPMVLASGMISPVVWLCTLMLSRSQDALVEIARFNAAYSWFAVISFVTAVLAQVEFVRMSQAKAAGEVSGVSRELRGFSVQIIVVMLPIASIMIAAAGPLMDFFRLHDVQAVRCLQVMIAAAFVWSLGSPAVLFLGVIDRIWLASAMNISWGLCVIVAAYWLRGLGAVGVAEAFLIAYLVHFLVAITLAFRILSRYRADKRVR